MTELLAALAGAAGAALLAFIGFRIQRIQTGQAVAQAFFEELSAIAFYEASFAGFSSQVFDSQFDKLFGLPAKLRRDLMRYHWRMKYLAELQASNISGVSMTVEEAGKAIERMWTMTEFIAEVEASHKELLARLQRYYSRSPLALFFFSNEPRA